MTRFEQAPQSRSIGTRELRTRQTPAEELLWRVIRGRQLDGLKFRRQHPIGLFVVDFCCPECRLIIELDGSVHESQRDYDAERDRWLQSAGYRVLRFPNEAVLHNLSTVLAAIQKSAENQSLPKKFSPLPAAGGVPTKWVAVGGEGP